MSLLINKANLIKVVLYYKPFGGTIRVETQDTMDEMEEEAEKSSFTKLTMKMKPLDWKLYNDLQKQSLVDNGPGMDDTINWVSYKENKFLAILTEWDAKEEGVDIELTPENIASLHPVIPELAMREYDSKAILGEETEPKSEENPPKPEEKAAKAEEKTESKPEVKAEEKTEAPS
jgi:hypothetical protein